MKDGSSDSSDSSRAAASANLLFCTLAASSMASDIASTEMLWFLLLFLGGRCLVDSSSPPEPPELESKRGLGLDIMEMLEIPVGGGGVIGEGVTTTLPGLPVGEEMSKSKSKIRKAENQGSWGRRRDTHTSGGPWSRC